MDDTLTRLELSDNVIKIIALAAFRKCGHLQQNIEFIEAAWKKADADFDIANSATEITTTKYARFKTHRIVNLSRIYKGGDKGSTSRSANSVAANIDTRFAASKTTQLQLQENQYQLGDAMNVLVQISYTSTLGGGGIPPMIHTKTTAGGSVPD